MAQSTKLTTQSTTHLGAIFVYDSVSLQRTADAELGGSNTTKHVNNGCYKPFNIVLGNSSKHFDSRKGATVDSVMIGGFIIGGADPTKVLVRAIGPSLSMQEITQRLTDPILELHDGNGELISTNDNWRSAQQTDIVATGLQPTNDSEAAIVTTLQPGSYTAIVRGQNSTTGVALVEVYNLDGASTVSK